MMKWLKLALRNVGIMLLWLGSRQCYSCGRSTGYQCVSCDRPVCEDCEAEVEEPNAPIFCGLCAPDPSVSTARRGKLHSMPVKV